MTSAPIWSADGGRRAARLAAGFAGAGLEQQLAAPAPDGAAAMGVRSLEVRWIFPGPLQTAMTAWFGRFPAELEIRVDAYLLSPDMRGLSVKVRGGETLDVKVYHGNRGILDSPGRARGRLQSWQKWSFPFHPLVQGAGDPVGWRTVHKMRHVSRFSRAGGVGVTPRLLGEPRCSVELTEIHLRGGAWWSLGLEATGPEDLLSGEIEAAGALLFAEAVPEAIELRIEDSRSYAEWLSLCQRRANLGRLRRLTGMCPDGDQPYGGR